jgi:flagellar M-ring protein FliF
MGQLQKILSSISVRQRISIGVVALLVAGGMLALLHWNKERDFKPLCTGLSSEEASAVIAKLKESGAEYRLADAGSTVLVPSGRADELRLQLAGAGLPKQGRIGYEIFDKTSIGTTDFTEQVNFHRALEGELERTIKLLSGVAGARVHITASKDSVFTENREPAKASVILTLKPGAQISPQAAAAVTQLVASAVEGLTPEGISVVDMQGNLLLRPKKPDDGSQPSEEILGFKAQLERDLLAKINSVLDPLLGGDKYRASVEVDCDQTSGEQSEESFDPTRSVMITSQRTEEGSVRQETAGAPGTQSNLPRPTPRTGAAGAGVAKRSESINYQTSRLVKRTKMPQGIVRRVSISVLTDNSIRWQVAGKGAGLHYDKVLEPPSEEQLKKIRDVVAAAAGFNVTRGDQLVVDSLPFQATLQAQPPPLPQPPLPLKREPARPKLPFPLPVMAGVGMALLALLGGLGYILLRSQRRARTRMSELQAQLAASAAAALAIARSGEEPGNGLGSGPAVSQPTPVSRRLAEVAGDFKLQPILTTKTEVLTRQLSDEAHKDPAVLAQIIRTWLNEERPGARESHT